MSPVAVHDMCIRGPLRFRVFPGRARVECAAKKSGTRKGGKAGQKEGTSIEKQKELLASLSASTQDAPEAAESGDEEDTGVTVVKKGKPKQQRQVEQLQGSLYAHPQIYDWAFGYRDYEEEVDFLFDAYEEIIGDEPLSFMELGCGPAQHSLEMAESKLVVYCVDTEARMLEYAAALASEDDLEMTCIEADIRDVCLPDGKQVDLAACLLGTFQHMVTQEDALRAFRSVHAALAPHGLFVVEMNHPALLFDGSLVTSADTWTIDVEDAQLEVLWGHEGDEFDAFAQVLHKSIEVSVMRRGGERQRISEMVALRQFTFQELQLLAQQGDFKVLRTYGDYSLDSRVDVSKPAAGSWKRPASAPGGDDADDPFRMILVLQKA